MMNLALVLIADLEESHDQEHLVEELLEPDQDLQERQMLRQVWLQSPQ